jgi:hypothetical protein
VDRSEISTTVRRSSTGALNHGWHRARRPPTSPRHVFRPAFGFLPFAFHLGVVQSANDVSRRLFVAQHAGLTRPSVVRPVGPRAQPKDRRHSVAQQDEVRPHPGRSAVAVGERVDATHSEWAHAASSMTTTRSGRLLSSFDWADEPRRVRPQPRFLATRSATTSTRPSTPQLRRERQFSAQ